MEVAVNQKKVRKLSLVLYEYKTYIIGLSELFISVSKLAELEEWAALVLKVMLAELSLILLLQGVDLTLISVEAVVV